jgi:hypothetical protein
MMNTFTTRWEKSRQPFEIEKTYSIGTEYRRQEFLLEFCKSYIDRWYTQRTKYIAKTLWIYDQFYWSDNDDK